MPAQVPVHAFLEALKSLDGVPYIFGGKDPHRDGGLDCSGAITYALKLAGGPDLTLTHNAARLYCETSHDSTGETQEGHLAFYGPPGGPSNHVMAVLAADGPTPAFRAYGSCGAGHTCLTVEMAKKLGAKVQARPKVLYRPDLIKTGSWIRLKYL